MSETATTTSQMILTPPDPVGPVPQEQAAAMVPIAEEQRIQLDRKVQEFIDTVITAEVNSEIFQEKIASIHSMGNDEIRAAANMSNHMLERPLKTMNQGLFDDKSLVGSSLINLRNLVERLDPSRQGDIASVRKLLGLIPLGNKLKNYFQQYQSAQTQINAIVEALYNGQDELRKDNASIDTEKARLWDTMTKLEQYVYVGKEIDKALEGRIAEIELQHPEKARIVKEEMLFYVRQKVQDLLTQLAVSIQGYLSLDMVRKNNLELIKGVDRATTTTLSALRTAVIVAQALTNQKLVLDQISALNKTTSDMIVGTARMMKQQATQIGEQAANSTVELNKLKAAFSDIYETMDMMSNYKVKTLQNLQATVNVLTEEVEKAKPYLDRIQREQAAAELAD